MEESHVPKRKETYKTQRTSPYLRDVFGLGIGWISFNLLPDQWKINWVYLTGVLMIYYIAVKFENVKLPLSVKWLISSCLYTIGLLLLIKDF